MRKLLYLLSLLTISIIVISCRNDNESENQANGSKINPPSWIKGKWKLNTNAYDQYYTFTDNDIIIQSLGQTVYIKPIADLGAYSQESSSTEFSFTFHQLNYYSQTYQFKKINSTKILFDNGIGGSDYDMWSELVRQ